MPSLERIKDMSEKILIVDDEVEIADLIEVYLKKRKLYRIQVLYGNGSTGMYQYDHA